MSRTVARLLAESLEAHDVDQIYCVPGESYIGLTSALIERNSIRVIVCRHEGGAGYMAVADGRLRDRAGVAVVSRGPGLSNAMVSLALGLSRRDPGRDAGRPGRAPGFRARRVAGAELFAPPVGRDQGGDRGQRAGTGLGSHRPRLSPGGKRHPGAGRGHPARGHLRRRDRGRARYAAAARRRRPARRGSRPPRRDAGPGRAAAGAGRRRDARRRGARQGGLRRPQPAGRGMGAADQPDPPPAASLRRDASEFRRLYGDPGAAGAASAR